MSGGRRAVAPSPSPRVIRLLLGAYPPSFRERYADELAALLEQSGLGVREGVDLLLGAARAWLRPTYGAGPGETRRLRLLSTVSTVWVGFCVVLCGTLGLLRLLTDPPVPGLALGTPRWVALQQVASLALGAACLLVLLGGAPLGIRALRSGAPARRTSLAPVAALVVLVVVGAALYAGLVLLPGAPMTASAYPLWFRVVAACWLLAVPVVAAWGAVGLARALRLSAPREHDLVASTLLSLLVVPALVAPVLLVLAVSYRSMRYWGTGVASLLLAGCLVVLVAAWTASAVSAVRGLVALRSTDRLAGQ